ncbi:hypothetical protein WR25_16216 [Diploscapter pachys]|uniref:FAD/NAD(P)-binding domain-containing protein n=1 Tax=Diploscapter pachys TaxID=2018661 RepID=A0A2A2KBG8_9BILA|nr:hypothetical protein WR25_16216 [Diploscapter pachys]
MSDRFDIVIVGAGHAGAQAAIALRQRGFAGTIAIIGDEPELPYERPPLSKDYLARDKSFDRLLLRPESFWREREVTMLLGQRVTAIDPVGHAITREDGDSIGYGTLIWATGGAPRRLTCPGHDLARVHAVRTRADVDRMMAELDDTTRVVVIGGGYIGLEAAAVLSKLGKSVTLIEALDRVLARVAGEAVSRFFEAEHRAHGVDIRLGCAAAGAACGNGVIVDAMCRTTLPDVYAIGDCAAHPNPYADGAVIRLESVQNANDQAGTVARAIHDAAEPYDAVPWFWSNQYDLKLQTVGLSTGHDQVVVRGDPASRSFSAIYLKDGQVIAIDAINSVKDYVQGRALVPVAPHPFGDQADHRLARRAEFGRRGIGDARGIARAFDAGHLHAEADAEIGDFALAGELDRLDLALRATLAERTGDEDRIAGPTYLPTTPTVTSPSGLVRRSMMSLQRDRSGADDGVMPKARSTSASRPSP